MATRSPFLESIRRDMRVQGYSLQTEKSYLNWIKRFILFSGKRHPEEMGVVEVRKFLTWLAVERHVSSNTQKTAFNALAYLYNRYIQKPLGDAGFRKCTRPPRMPVVLSQQEVSRILRHTNGHYSTQFKLLYGSGLRISECLRVRVIDIDMERNCLTVRSGKGLLPPPLTLLSVVPVSID